MDANYNEMDVNMFDQYMYKSNEENLNVSLSVQGQQQQFSGQQQHQSIANQYSGTMSDHTFHTPSFGDEEFDIPVDVLHHPTQAQQHNQLDQFQMHGMINNQHQQASQTYVQHQQWTQQPSTTELTYQNHSDYHHMTTNASENILMMPQQQQQQQLMNTNTNNYVETPASAPISNSHENGSTSDDSDDPNNTFKNFDEDGNVKGEIEDTKKIIAVKANTVKGKKKKRDPNEPLKPVSAYALFFRDTQAAIKGQNPNASFGEVSKIVASMWDVLAPEHKNVYKKKQETAKKEYLKALSAYRAGNLQSSEGGETTLINQTPIAVAVTTQSIQNFTPQVQTMTAPTFPQQNFVSQPIINQAVIQQLPAQQQQQAPINQFENNQQISQQQQVYQQPQQQQQQPLQSITNNNNQMPPVATQPAHQNYEKCIRNGCLNPAIVSVDWEDEYCSNECVIQHCREVFGNFIQMNSSNQQINFPVK